MRPPGGEVRSGRLLTMADVRSNVGFRRLKVDRIVATTQIDHETTIKRMTYRWGGLANLRPIR